MAECDGYTTDIEMTLSEIDLYISWSIGSVGLLLHGATIARRDVRVHQSLETSRSELRLGRRGRASCVSRAVGVDSRSGLRKVNDAGEEAANEAL